MSINLIISGCGGRMGSRIAELAMAESMVSVSAVLEVSGHQTIGKPFGPMKGHTADALRVSDDAREAFGQGDVVIEFTTPACTMDHLRLATSLKKAMVIGTTGLSKAQAGELKAAATEIPIVYSPNMSVGVTVLFELVQTALRRLGPSYDVDVLEAHHRHKQDAPSGTAKRLAELLAAVRGQPSDSIPVHVVRAGEIVGDHTVILSGPSERLELTHRAQSRDVFAQGALAAAQFVHGRRPGLYDMSDVLRGDGLQAKGSQSTGVPEASRTQP